MDLIGAYADELGISRREAAHEVEGLLFSTPSGDYLDSTTEALLDELCDITSHSVSLGWARV